MTQFISLALIGFLFGFRHAFDADHLAAAAVLNSRAQTKRIAALRGAAWGLGHSAVITILGILVIVFNMRISAGLGIIFERAVAIFLILLGGNAIWRYIKSAHGIKRNADILIHDHPPMGVHAHMERSFFVGIMHGLAGSAALFALIIAVIKSAFAGITYIVFFNIGSISGMIAASLALYIVSARLKMLSNLIFGLASIGIAAFKLF